MPNYCYYEMKVRGSKESCQKWLQKMRSYDEPNHFWRMFDPVDVIDEGGTVEDYFMEFCGDCAWSLESCCRSTGYSEGVDLFEVNTRDLSLVMEAYSSEPGCEFQEHYIYKNGECVTDRCIDYEEFYWDKSECGGDFSEYKKKYDIPTWLTESDFDDEGNAHIGGFKSWEFVI